MCFYLWKDTTIDKDDTLIPFERDKKNTKRQITVRFDQNFTCLQ